MFDKDLVDSILKKLTDDEADVLKRFFVDEYKNGLKLEPRILRTIENDIYEKHNERFAITDGSEFLCDNYHILFKNSSPFTITLYGLENTRFKDCSFKCKLYLTNDYPHKEPFVQFDYDLNHPNFVDYNKITFESVTGEKWFASCSLDIFFKGIIQKICIIDDKNIVNENYKNIGNKRFDEMIIQFHDSFEQY